MIVADENFFAFGLGYVARHAGAGTGTSSRAGGIAFDAVNAQTLAPYRHVLISVPPNADGDPVLTRYGDLLAAQDITCVVYLSTTGVYGDTGGAWVDETSLCNPSEPRSQWRLSAERAWQDWARVHHKPLFIMRLSGIYGPGRNVLDDLRAGRARRILKPGHVFGRIHADDIARAIHLAFAQPDKAGVYNLTDDEPAPSDKVVEYGAQLLGLAPPPAVPWTDADLSPMARSFYAACRRVRNDKIKQELGLVLRYPTYREGLRALL